MALSAAKRAAASPRSAFDLKVLRAGDSEAAPQRKPHRARKPQNVNRALRSHLFFIAFAVAVMATVYMMRSALISSRGYELVQVTQQAAQLEHENKQLEMQIARLKAPQRVKDIAGAAYGFTLPQEIYFGDKR